MQETHNLVHPITTNAEQSCLLVLWMLSLSINTSDTTIALITKKNFTTLLENGGEAWIIATLQIQNFPTLCALALMGWRVLYSNITNDVVFHSAITSCVSGYPILRHQALKILLLPSYEFCILELSFASSSKLR